MTGIILSLGMNAGCAMNPSMDFCARWDLGTPLSVQVLDTSKCVSFQGFGGRLVRLLGSLLNFFPLLADSPHPPSPWRHPRGWSPLACQQASAKVRIKMNYVCLPINKIMDGFKDSVPNSSPILYSVQLTLQFSLV